MFYAFGGSKTLVKHTFSSWSWHEICKNIDRHQKKQKKQTTRCTKHRQAPKKQKKQKIQQLLRSGPIVPGNFSFFGFCWCLCRFGASSGLVFLVFLVPVQVWWLWLHKTLTGTKKTKKTKPLDAPNIDRHQKNQKIQQLLRSGPIVPGNFSFFGFFGACAGLVHLVASSGLGFFGACAGLVTLTSQNFDRHQKKQKKQTTRCTKHRQAPKKPKKTKIPATTQKWTHSSWKF